MTPNWRESYQLDHGLPNHSNHLKETLPIPRRNLYSPPIRAASRPQKFFAYFFIKSSVPRLRPIHANPKPLYLT